MLIEGNTNPGTATIKYTFEYNKQYKDGQEELYNNIMNATYMNVFYGKEIDNNVWIKIL